MNAPQVGGVELLPCPFCEGEAKRFTIQEPGDNFGGDVIQCMGVCGASSHVEFGRKENLVSLWNTRATPLPALTDTVGALVEALKGADAAITEMFRYFDGGETRGSYDGKPERDQLRKAGYKTRAAIQLATGGQQ